MPQDPDDPAAVTIACPDCKTPFPGVLKYDGCGRWRFVFACANGRCPNHLQQYVGTIQEVDKQPELSGFDLARLAGA